MRRGISQLAEDLLDSHRELCSMYLGVKPLRKKHVCFKKELIQYRTVNTPHFGY